MAMGKSQFNQDKNVPLIDPNGNQEKMQTIPFQLITNPTTINKGGTGMETSHQNVPNGFNASISPNHYRLKTTSKIGIQLDLPSKGTVTIRADDILGRTISSQDTYYDEGGTYLKTLRNAFYSGGVYFIIVTFDNQTISKTVTVID
jgi:hypothetical protein